MTCTRASPPPPSLPLHSCCTWTVPMAAVVHKELISKIRSRSENQIHSIENGNHIGKPPVPAKKGKVVTRLPSNSGWSTCPPKPPPYREILTKKKSDGDAASEPSLQKESPATTPDRGLPSPNGLQVRKMYIYGHTGIHTQAQTENFTLFVYCAFCPRKTLWSFCLIS